MPTVLLVRHGRTAANVDGVLAGRSPGVGLDAVGREQVGRAGQRLAVVPLARLVTSPLARCRQTARALAEARDEAPEIVVDRGLTECDYGTWQGRALKELADEPMWSTVQTQPSAAVFPGGEAVTTVQARAVEAIRRHDRMVEAEHGPAAVWVAVSHGDVIKAVLGDAYGMHLDLFQRIVVNPASVSIVRYTPARPYVVASNTDAGDLSWLRTQATAPQESDGDDAAVGGGAGPGPSRGHRAGASVRS